MHAVWRTIRQLICSGFTDLLEERREARDSEESDGESNMEISSQQDENMDCARLQQRCLAFITGHTEWGRRFSNFIMFLIIANVLAVVLESVQYLEDAAGLTFWNAFEGISVGIFTIEYVVRLFSARQDPEHKYSRLFYATTFFGRPGTAIVFKVRMFVCLHACC